MRVALVLLTLALLAAGVPQQRRGRQGPRRPPGGSGRARAAQAARSVPEDSAEWVRCERSVAGASTARHVVTARVEQVGALTSHLQVKRVLRGDALPSRLVVSTCSHACCALRRRDTRVFLLGEPDTEAVFPQVSPPLTLSLKTLGLVWSPATDVPYEPRPPIQEESCEQQVCDWGGECVTDETGATSCACPTSCPPPSSTTSPVCGTDGATYPTICELRRHACRLKLNIRIRHSGACDVEDAPQEEEDDSEPRGRDRTPASDHSNTTTSTPD